MKLRKKDLRFMFVVALSFSLIFIEGQGWKYLIWLVNVALLYVLFYKDAIKQMKKNMEEAEKEGLSSNEEESSNDNSD